MSISLGGNGAELLRLLDILKCLSNSAKSILPGSLTRQIEIKAEGNTIKICQLQAGIQADSLIEPLPDLFIPACLQEAVAKIIVDNSRDKALFDRSIERRCRRSTGTMQGVAITD